MSTNQSRKMIFSIYHYDPDKDEKPRMQDYELDIGTIKGKMLLNALEAIKETHPDIGFRRSCGEGVCGSDGMNINGKNGLACVTPLHELPGEAIKTTRSLKYDAILRLSPLGGTSS